MHKIPTAAPSTRSRIVHVAVSGSDLRSCLFDRSYSLDTRELTQPTSARVMKYARKKREKERTDRASEAFLIMSPCEGARKKNEIPLSGKERT